MGGVKMKLTKLFEQQEKLENFIFYTKKLEGDYFKLNVISFNQELAEFANELRFFKYWSNRGPAEMEVILEEGIDALNVLLIIGLDFKENEFDIFGNNYNLSACSPNLADQYIDVIKKTLSLLENKNIYMYTILVESFLGMLHTVGFTEKEIKEMFYKKNKINFQRQVENY